MKHKIHFKDGDTVHHIKKGKKRVIKKITRRRDALGYMFIFFNDTASDIPEYIHENDLEPWAKRKKELLEDFYDEHSTF